MYKGSQIRQLEACAWSLKLTAWGLTLATYIFLSLELDAWNLDLLQLRSFSEEPSELGACRL